MTLRSDYDVWVPYAMMTLSTALINETDTGKRRQPSAQTTHDVNAMSTIHSLE